MKKLVFISHIAVEKDLALALKSVVDDAFMGMIDVFVSSDPKSIAMGGRWLDEITHGLKTCVIEIILASPASVRRPWVNFEAGAGWVRDVPVIPLCHSGMTPSTLPPPLSSLQAGLATDAEQLQRVFDVLAKAIDCKSPTVDFQDLIARVESFESTSRRLDAAADSALTAHIGGLSDLEIATLVATAECSGAPGDKVWPRNVRERMGKAGFREIATSLGIAGLDRKGLLGLMEEGADFGEVAIILTITTNGWLWLGEHENLLDVRLPEPADEPSYTDDEIPF